MKKVVYEAPFQVTVQECPVPEISAGQVLLKMISVGVCGSDMQIYHGKHHYMTYPVVGGHEGSAVIVQAAPDVTDFRVGQKVSIEPQISCGKCYPCRIGRFNVCEHLKVKGVHADGLLAEYVAIDTKYLHHCPDDMSTDLITLVEPMSVGVGSVKRSHYKGANVAVIGAGTIGNLISQAAQALGAGRVLITDVVDSKLEFAKQCGVECAVNTKDKSLKQAIEETFGERKADVIIDAAGVPFTFAAALDAARPCSEIVMTANYHDPVTFDVPRIQRNEISIIGHMMYVREDFADAIRFLYEKKVHMDGFITQRYPIDRIAEGYKYISENPGRVMKAVIDIAEP